MIIDRAKIIAALICPCLICTACSNSTESSLSESDTAVSDSASLPSSNVTESAQSFVENQDVSDGSNLKTGAYSNGTMPQLSGVKLKLTINSTEDVIIAMYDNTAADALLQRLPLNDLSFYDLSGLEKPIQRLDEPISLGDETPGYDPIAGEMVIYRPWGIFTFFYEDYGYSDELVPLGIVESGLESIASQTDDFKGVLDLLE